MCIIWTVYGQAWESRHCRHEELVNVFNRVYVVHSYSIFSMDNELENVYK